MAVAAVCLGVNHVWDGNGVCPGKEVRKDGAKCNDLPSLSMAVDYRSYAISGCPSFGSRYRANPRQHPSLARDEIL